MSLSGLFLCRLCMGTEMLSNIYKNDGDTSLDIKINSCIGIKIKNDGLPIAICILCEKNIKEFYEFKQKCLEVNTKFSVMNKPLSTSHQQKIGGTIIKINVATEMEDTYYVDNYKSDDKSNLKETHQLNTMVSSNIRQAKSCQRKQPNKDSKNIVLRNQHQNKFKKKTTLQKYTLSHTGMKVFPCMICSKCFTRDQHRSVHMNSHMGIRPYLCEICGATSTKKQDLQRHKKIHSDEKKYACPKCDRRFKRSHDVSIHMRTHTGVRPYSCTHCQKSYSSHSGLQKHNRTHKKDNFKHI